jgi:hypothetical protein
MSAKVVALHVRNEMEDFHCKHLSDDQMKELKWIIRKATWSEQALYGRWQVFGYDELLKRDEVNLDTF